MLQIYERTPKIRPQLPWAGSAASKEERLELWRSKPTNGRKSRKGRRLHAGADGTMTTGINPPARPDPYAQGYDFLFANGDISESLFAEIMQKVTSKTTSNPSL